MRLAFLRAGWLGVIPKSASYQGTLEAEVFEVFSFAAAKKGSAVDAFSCATVTTAGAGALAAEFV